MLQSLKEETEGNSKCDDRLGKRPRLLYLRRVRVFKGVLMVRSAVLQGICKRENGKMGPIRGNHPLLERLTVGA